MEFLGQRSDPCCTCDLYHSCSNARSLLTHCAGPGIELASRHSRDLLPTLTRPDSTRPFCNSRNALVSFFSDRIKASYLDPIREEDVSRLNLSLCEGWSISALLYCKSIDFVESEQSLRYLSDHLFLDGPQTSPLQHQKTANSSAYLCLRN